MSFLIFFLVFLMKWVMCLVVIFNVLVLLGDCLNWVVGLKKRLGNLWLIILWRVEVFWVFYLLLNDFLLWLKILIFVCFVGLRLLYVGDWYLVLRMRMLSGYFFFCMISFVLVVELIFFLFVLIKWMWGRLNVCRYLLLKVGCLY